MAFQECPSIAEAVIRFTANSVECVNILHFRFGTTTYDENDIQDLAGLVDLWVQDDYLACISDDVTYVRTDVRGLASENDFFASSDVGSGPGLVASPAATNSVTVAISLRSNLTGRSARGRLFLVGVPTNQIDTDTNFFIDGFAPTLITHFSALGAALISSGWTWVILSRFSGGAPRAEGVGFPVSNVVLVDQRFDSQRRRLG